MTDYSEKENYLIEYDVEWRKKHLNHTTFKENKDIMTGTVLYVGCNTGTSTTILADYCDKVIGIDINEKALQKAVKYQEQYKKNNIEYFTMDMQNLTFEDNSIDSIYMIQVLEHIYEKDMGVILSELQRVLKPNGAIIIEVPHPNSPYYINPVHVSHFENEDQLFTLLSKYFSVEKIIHETRKNPGIPGKHDDWRVICQK